MSEGRQDNLIPSVTLRSTVPLVHSHSNSFPSAADGCLPLAPFNNYLDPEQANKAGKGVILEKKACIVGEKNPCQLMLN